MDQPTLPLKSLTHAEIARKWVDSFQDLEAKMLTEIEPYLSDDFELICPGESDVVPFAGIWNGSVGHQRWLDLFFGFFQRTKTNDVSYTETDHSVIARWKESVILQGAPCDPVRISMYFHFLDGRLARIFDDYDTQTGSSSITQTLSLAQNDHS